MTPILPLIIQTLVQHLHNFHKIIPGQSDSVSHDNAVDKLASSLIIGQLRNLIHLSPGWTPGIVRSRISDFSLRLVSSMYWITV